MLFNFLGQKVKHRKGLRSFSGKHANPNQEYFRALDVIFKDQSQDNLSVVKLLPHKEHETLFQISNQNLTNSIVISGFPIDTSTTNIGGARYGPAFMRRFTNHYCDVEAIDTLNEMAELKHFCLENKIIDQGDCLLDFHSPQGIKYQIIDYVKAILSQNNRMLSLGGDHYISYPLLVAHKNHYGHPITILHFDAHHDTVSEEDPNSINHATMFYHAMKDGTINIQNSIQVGIRERVDTEEGEEMKFLSSEWIRTNGIDCAIETILNTLGNNPVYLTFDIDCLDPKIAPGTGTPIPKGMQVDEIIQIFEGLKGKVKFIGADLVEYAPRYDKSFKTLKVVMNLLHQLLSLLKNSSQE